MSEPSKADHAGATEYYVKGNVIHKSPVRTKTETGTNISIGFPVCTASEYVDAKQLLPFFNGVAAAEQMAGALEAILPFIPKTTASEGGASAYSAHVVAADKVRAALSSWRKATGGAE